MQLLDEVLSITHVHMYKDKNMFQRLFRPKSSYIESTPGGEKFN
jgi:hypothetical protein